MFAQRRTANPGAGLLVWAAAGLALLALAARPARAGDMERAMLERAPEVLKYLRDHGYHRAGVLKFRVKKDGKTSDNAGPLNLNLASRLETALLVKYDMTDDRDLVLLHDASATAAAIPGASHLTPEGRALLFGGEYSPRWGDGKKVRADAFLTGVACFSDDLRTVTVKVLAFDPNTKRMLDKVVFFAVPADLNTLAESGETFGLKSALTRKGTIELTDLPSEAAETAKETKQSPEPPKVIKEGPVVLEVHYAQGRDDRVVPVEFADGQARLPEPTEGQHISFKIVRKDSGRDRFGVVLMVNGVNTLYDERLAPELCTKWIIDPGAAPLTVKGFHVKVGDREEGHEFRIASVEESKANEVKYGADVGKISFTVFREQPGAPAKPAPKLDEAEGKKEESAVLNPKPPADLPTGPGPAKDQVLREADDVQGLVEHGASYDSAVEHVPFKSPVMVTTLTITYYKPGGR